MLDSSDDPTNQEEHATSCYTSYLKSKIFSSGGIESVSGAGDIESLMNGPIREKLMIIPQSVPLSNKTLFLFPPYVKEEGKKTMNETSNAWLLIQLGRTGRDCIRSHGRLLHETTDPRGRRASSERCKCDSIQWAGNIYFPIDYLINNWELMKYEQIVALAVSLYVSIL